MSEGLLTQVFTEQDREQIKQEEKHVSIYPEAAMSDGSRPEKSSKRKSITKTSTFVEKARRSKSAAFEKPVHASSVYEIREIRDSLGLPYLNKLCTKKLASISSRSSNSFQNSVEKRDEDQDADSIKTDPEPDQTQNAHQSQI